MRCLRCGICCQETDMMLSEEDVARLEKRGYSRKSFMRIDEEGYALLRNRQGHCVFYNSQQRRCDVYALRPAGCRVYPVVFDEESGVIVDFICHAQGSISEGEQARKGKLVIKLLEKIDAQAQARRSK